MGNLCMQNCLRNKSGKRKKWTDFLKLAEGENRNREM